MAAEVDEVVECAYHEINISNGYFNVNALRLPALRLSFRLQNVTPPPLQKVKPEKGGWEGRSERVQVHEKIRNKNCPVNIPRWEFFTYVTE